MMKPIVAWSTLLAHLTCVHGFAGGVSDQFLNGRQEQWVELSFIDRTLLMEYQLLGREVPLLIAADPGRGAELMRRIEALGAKVISREDDIGYLYVLSPSGSVENLTKIPGIDAIQVDCNPVRGDAADDDLGKLKKSAASPDPFLKLDNPFTSEASTQASIFKTRYPTFDGRGATSGFVESADPNLPSMKGALDLKGVPVAKFATYSWGSSVDAVGADAVAEGSFWHHTTVVMPDANGRLSFSGQMYTVPPTISAKEWRICIRRPSPFAKKKEDVAVLWAVDAQRVWMLHGEGRDFAKAPTAEVEQPFFFMIVHAYDAKDNYESRLWVFNVRESDRMLAFAGTHPSHPSMVASVLAGNGFLGSRAGGIAPAARLAVFSGAGHETMPSRNTAESTFAAFHDPAVDEVESSATVGDSARESSSRVYGFFADRLIRLTQKPFAHAIGNFGPSFGFVDDFNSSGEIFSIGGFVPQETWRANEGFEPSSDITLAEYSGWGPSEGGGLKPDFLALTQTLSESSYSHSAYEEPYGLYTVSGGTSAAAPNAAGHLALLISAAKQSGVKYDPARLRAAIATTAKFLLSVPARAQGYGLIQVADAWEALKRADHWEPPIMVVSAPVVGGESARSGVIYTGRGLLEKSGWAPGASGDRELIVTRLSGPPTPLTYQLHWKESDTVPAFSSPLTHITLGLNQPVKIAVNIHVAESGSYSAILHLIDERANLVAKSIMNTIFVGQPLTTVNGFSTSLTRTLERPGNSTVWIEVPQGLSGLHLHVKRADGRDGGRLNVQDPTERSLPYSLYGSPQGDPSIGKFVKGEAYETFPNPVPGLWQFNLQEPGSALQPSAERLKSSEIRWEIAGSRIDSKSEVSSDATSGRSLEFTNAGGGPVQAKISAMGIGSAHSEEVLLKPGLHAETFRVEVPAGASRLEVSIEMDDPTAPPNTRPNSPPVTRVGLYIFKAPEGPDKKFGDPKTGGDATALVYQDASWQALKRWTLDSPLPGTYVVALDPLTVPDHGVTVHYRDVVYHSLFGTVTCDDTNGTLQPGASKSATVHWHVTAKPADGRKLVAEVGLIDESRGYSKAADTEGEKKLEIVPVPLATQTLEIDR